MRLNYFLVLVLAVRATTAWAQGGRGPAVQAERNELDMDAGFLGAMPRERRGSVVGFLTLHTPGGLFADGDPAAAETQSTRILVDGFRMEREWLPVLALSTARMSRWGYGAAQADVPSGLVSLRTRPPGEGAHAEIETSADWRRDRGDEPGLTRQIFMPMVTAPLIRDRVFVMVASQFERERSDGDSDPSGFFARSAGLRRNRMQTAVKLTWLATPKGQLSLLALRSEISRGAFGALNVDKEAYLVSQNQAWFAGLAWKQGLTDRWRWDVAGAWSRAHDQTAPASCRMNPDTCDQTPPIQLAFPQTILLGNADKGTEHATDRFSSHTALTWDAPDLGPVGQRIAVGVRGEIESRDSATRTPGDQKIFGYGALNSSRTQFFLNDPRLATPRVGSWQGHVSQSTAIAFIEDRINLGSRLTVTPGLAVLATQGASDYAHFADQVILPQLSAAWDVTRDGKTIVRAGVQRRSQADFISFAQHSLGGPVLRSCNWDEATKSYSNECRVQGGVPSHTLGLPCNSNGVDMRGTPCLEKVSLPHTWEVAGGVERSLPLNLVLGVDVVHRRTTGQPVRGETNRVWNNSGSELDRTAPYRNGLLATVTNLSSGSNFHWYETHTTPYLERRAGQRLRFRLAYDRAYFTDGEPEPPEQFDIGRPAYQHSSVHAMGVFEPYRSVSLGMVYRYLQGDTIRRPFLRVQPSARDDLRVRTNVGSSDINDPPDDRPTRSPDAQSLELQIRGKLSTWRLQIEPFLDIFGILAPRATRADDDGPRFSDPRATEGRYGFRLGVAGRI